MIIATKRRVRRNRKDQWEPTAEFLKKAQFEYLLKGGQIEYVVVTEKDYPQFMSIPNSTEF